MALLNSGQLQVLDWVDRANSFWSALLLAVLAVAVFLLRLLGSPFICWSPAHFTDQHVLYTDAEASLAGLTYAVLPESDVPSRSPSASLFASQHMAAPLLLLLQALGFLLPCLLWRLARPLLAPALPAGCPLKRLGPQEAGREASLLAGVMLSSLRGGRSRLALGYMAMKGLALFNLLCQLTVLTVFFWPRLNILASHDQNLPHFPTKFLVDFETRRHKSVHRHMVQCLSPVNDALIRLFVFLWYWTLFLGCLTLLQALVTAASLFLPACRDRQLEVLLHAARCSGQGAGQGAGPRSGDDVWQWASGTLGADGVLLLSRICSSLGPLTAALLAGEMWRMGAPPPPGPSHLAVSLPSQPGAPHPGGQDVPLTTLSKAEEADADAGVKTVAL